MARQSDIDTVVDDQLASMCPRLCARSLRELKKIAGGHGFDTKLKNGGAAFEQVAQYRFWSTVLGLCRIEDGVERRQDEGWHEFLGGVFFERDAQIGDFLPQRVSIDAEDLRGADLIALGLLQRQFDKRPFDPFDDERSEEHTSELQSQSNLV